MKRTKLKQRLLPDYTRGEEQLNTISHIVGGGCGIIILIIGILKTSLTADAWAVVCAAIYGAALVTLYTVSSVYHGLRHSMGKKVMQVLDHCIIYFLIGGTYTPILLCSIRIISPLCAWILFGLVWGIAAMAITFTAIDLKKYAVLSMICYIGIGWCIVLAAPIAIRAIPLPGLLWLLSGGVAYTIGAVLYGLGKRHRYMHGVFHIFVVLGSVLQAICILWYVF